GTFGVASRRNAPSLSAGGEVDDTVNGVIGQSADGRYVVFTHTAQNLVAGQISGLSSESSRVQNSFLRDSVGGTTTLVSHAYNSASRGADGNSGVPVISADGRYVAYASYASNLIASFTDGNGPPVPNTGFYTGTDVFLFDRATGINTLVSHIAGDPTT